MYLLERERDGRDGGDCTRRAKDAMEESGKFGGGSEERIGRIWAELQAHASGCGCGCGGNEKVYTALRGKL